MAALRIGDDGLAQMNRDVTMAGLVAQEVPLKRS